MRAAALRLFGRGVGWLAGGGGFEAVGGVVSAAAVAAAAASLAEERVTLEDMRIYFCIDRESEVLLKRRRTIDRDELSSRWGFQGTAALEVQNEGRQEVEKETRQ